MIRRKFSPYLMITITILAIFFIMSTIYAQTNETKINQQTSSVQDPQRDLFHEKIQLNSFIGWMITLICAITGWTVATWNNNNQFYRRLCAETADELIRRLHEWTEQCANLLSESQGFIWLFQTNKVHPVNNNSKIVDQYRKLCEQISLTLVLGGKCQLYYESRQVILYKFASIVEQIKKDFDLLEKSAKKIVYESLNNCPMTEFPIPNDEQQGNLSNLSTGLMDNIIDIQGHIYDFIVELQNTYFSRRFHHTASRRQPPDPNVRVLTVDD